MSIATLEAIEAQLARHADTLARLISRLEEEGNQLGKVLAKAWLARVSELLANTRALKNLLSEGHSIQASAHACTVEAQADSLLKNLDSGGLAFIGLSVRPTILLLRSEASTLCRGMSD